MRALTLQSLQQTFLMSIKQPPYSPDMNLLDRYVFRNLEFARRNKSFNNKEEVEHFLNEFLNEKMTRFKLSRELNRLQED